jgi:hypothetical protein
MNLKYIAAMVAVGTAFASTPASAMPISNLAAVAPSMTDNVRYCRHRGCARAYVVRRYSPSYYAYGPSYYDSYAYSPYYYDSYAYGPAYFGPSISFGFGFGRGFGHWGRWGRW